MGFISSLHQWFNRLCSSISGKYKYYFNSIRYRIIILVMLAILVPSCLFGTYMYSFIYHNILSQYINNKLEQSIGQINDSLVSKFRIVENASNLFLSNQIIRSNLNELLTQEQTYYLKARTRLDIETQLKYSVLHDYAWNSGLLKSVFIFLDKDNYYYLLSTYLPNDDIVKDHLSFYNSSQNTVKDSVIIKPSKDFKTIYFMKDIKTLVTKQSIGRLVFSIDENTLQEVSNNIITDKNSKAFIFDDEGTIFFHTDRSLIGKKVDKSFLSISNSSSIREFDLDDTIYIVDSEKISDMNLTSVIMVPKTEFTSNLNNVIPEYLYIIVFAVLLSIILSMFVIANITKPIKDLIINIEEVNDGNFSSKMPQYKYSELNEVSITFNDMIDKIQYLFNEVYKKQILLTEAELKALEAQINPHFLFNVLETISWEARMSNNETIYKMINSLGQLLRASLTFNSCEKIMLKNELEYIEFYLYLQKMRFGNRLNVDISICDDTLLDSYLPKLCIQPIVENAVIHGLENKVGNGNLSLCIKKENNTIHIQVTDDGVGFNPDKLDFNSDYNTQLGDDRKHIGLLNVDKRIKLIYGNQYGISIKSKLNVGTKISIYIPFDRGDN